MDARNNKVLSTAEYWNQRYSRQITITSGESSGNGNDNVIVAHEWSRSFQQLQKPLERYMEICPKDGAILHLGCGDSTLPADLYALGYQNQICVDFSQVVLDLMKQRYQSLAIEWLVMDLRYISLPEESIDLAIDKCTLDAFLHGSMWDPPDDVRENVAKYVDCVVKVLRRGARWIYITYRQPHFMKPLLARNHWDLQVETLNDDAGGFEYFAFIMVKHK